MPYPLPFLLFPPSEASIYNIVLVVLSASKIVAGELVEVMPLELMVSEQWVRMALQNRTVLLKTSSGYLA